MSVLVSSGMPPLLFTDEVVLLPFKIIGHGSQLEKGGVLSMVQG